jgi:hypothetical protein
MPFKDKDLQKLSQDIINNAVQRQTPAQAGNILIQSLRQSIRKQKQPKVY